MEKALSILSPFLEDPLREFHIRELAKILKKNHMTIRAYLNTFVKEGFLLKKKSKLYDAYQANTTSKRLRNLKLYYNLEMLRKSKLIEDIELVYDYPTIVLFGSYATATNVKESDIDICIITNISKEFNIEKYRSLLKRNISIHKFAEKEFSAMKRKNPELINSICNGIVLSGKLEVV